VPALRTLRQDEAESRPVWVTWQGLSQIQTKKKKKKKEKDGIRRKTLTMQPKNLFR
jgi:hypothetical protein